MLIIIRGLPGSGKSTFAKKNYPNLLHLENDMFHYDDEGNYQWKAENQPKAIQWCLDATDMALGRNMSVVVSNTFTRRKFVNAYVRLAKLHNQPYRVIRLNTQYGNIHSVPANILENMKNGFEDYEGEEIVNQS